jgi:hypothetical protein
MCSGVCAERAACAGRAVVFALVVVMVSVLALAAAANADGREKRRPDAARARQGRGRGSERERCCRRSSLGCSRSRTLACTLAAVDGPGWSGAAPGLAARTRPTRRRRRQRAQGFNAENLHDVARARSASRLCAPPGGQVTAAQVSVVVIVVFVSDVWERRRGRRRKVRVEAAPRPSGERVARDEWLLRRREEAGVPVGANTATFDASFDGRRNVLPAISSVIRC